MKKIIIIDDEYASRKLIREYLQEYKDCIIIAEASNGQEAIELIKALSPDLIFLDVQMPVFNGFEVLMQLDEIPQVIFATAYDQYALKAFDVHALDYLLKPYTKSRFAKAMEKIPKPEILQNFTESLFAPTTFTEKFFVQVHQKLFTIDSKDIIFISAEGDYACLVTQKGKFLTNFGIGIIEKKLNPQDFIRIHRSTIIHLAFVKEIQKQISSYDVIMTNGDVLRVSRGYMDKIKERIV
ncbi:MAG: DNA-binding response regulator [Cytophagia bacterium]|nr:MAG: DNA-binding response regulator [Cytophagales bacterium]TAG00785.1 MAG: DNA-binding response regulator [Cytophagia bacterium]TAG38127.1 MAG: DNA-binding response regulator [Cytophagia bacterium]TAH28109.1 MAG: DNA-binding response regulator [Cytophagales bacterium]